MAPREELADSLESHRNSHYPGPLAIANRAHTRAFRASLLNVAKDDRWWCGWRSLIRTNLPRSNSLIRREYREVAPSFEPNCTKHLRIVSCY